MGRGVDSNKHVHPILTDNDGRQYIIITDSDGHTLDITSSNKAITQVFGFYPDSTHQMPSGDARARPIFTTPGAQDSFHIHLHKDAIDATTAFMLIDLSDTVNWPHTLTGGVTLYRILLSIAATKIADAHVKLGWLENVDGDNGDMHTIHTWEVGHAGTNEPRDIDTIFDYQLVNYKIDKAKWFGPSLMNNALFQTDVELGGPNDIVTNTAADGDVVLLVTVAAGILNVACSIDYETFA